MLKEASPELDSSKKEISKKAEKAKTDGVIEKEEEKSTKQARSSKSVASGDILSMV